MDSRNQNQNEQTWRPSLQDRLESPFAEEDLFVEHADAPLYATLAALETETPFRTAFERDLTDLATPEAPEEEFAEDEVCDVEALAEDDAEELQGELPDEEFEDEILGEDLENEMGDGLQALRPEEELEETLGEALDDGVLDEARAAQYMEEGTFDEEDLVLEGDESPRNDAEIHAEEAEYLEAMEEETPDAAPEFEEEAVFPEEVLIGPEGAATGTLRSDDVASVEEETALDEEPFAELEEEEGDEGEIEWEALEFEQAPAVPATTAERAVSLGREWSQRRNGSPTPEAMTDWLLRDYQETMEGARREFKSKYSVEALGRAWLISREQHMKFQNDFPPGIRGLGTFQAPTDVTLVPSRLIEGSDKAPVAPLMAHFVQELRRHYPSFLTVRTRGGHGGAGFKDRGFSVDLSIEGKDNRGFYVPDEAVRFLQAVNATARAVDAEWRAIYNDFSVADRINRETGRHHVIFVGQARKQNNKVTGLNWHGPDPLILHFHLDVTPGAGAPVAGVGAASASAVTPAPSPARRAGKPPAELTRFIQRVLNAAEGERLAVDGDFGPRTRGALERFRKKYGLGAGGVLDDRTQLALAQRAIEEIRQQSLFGQLGVLDATTRAALIAFKSSGGLGGDTSLDAATRTALIDALARQQSAPAARPAAGQVGAGGAPSSTPEGVPGRLGTLVFRRDGKTVYRYAFTPEDLLWTARLISGEAGARDDLENRAVIAAMFNRFALFTHRVYPAFSKFIRAYSTPLQAVLLNKDVARHYMNDPRFVRLGGTYKGTNIPRGQLKRHIEIQKTPWEQLRPLARKLALEALTGRMPDTGIGAASEFASTWILYGRRVGPRNRTEPGWLAFTQGFKRQKGWRWIGHRPNLDQKRNAFFIDPRAANLPPDAITVDLPA